MNHSFTRFFIQLVFRKCYGNDAADTMAVAINEQN